MFNSAPPFGQQQQSIFGQTSNLFAPEPFGSPTTPFGTQAAGSVFSGTFANPASSPVSSAPSFGTPTFSPASGTSSFAGTSIFGQKPATTGFGAPTTPAFSLATPAPAFGIGLGGGFGTPTTPSFSTPTTPSPFSSTPSPFGTQSSSFSFQTTTPSTLGTPGTFGQPVFGQQQKSGGSRAVAYAQTDAEEILNGKAQYFQSISIMPAYAEKSHEELRCDDYQLGDKGGLKWGTPQPNPSEIIQPNSFNSTPTNRNPFGLKTTGFPSYTSPMAGPFATGTSLTSTNLFNQPSTPAFTPYNFNTPSTAPSLFNSTPATPNPFTFQQPNNAPFNSTPSAPNPFTFQQPNNAPFNLTPAAPNPFSTTPTFQQPNNVFNQPTTPPFSPFNSGTTPSSTHSTTPSPFNSTPASTNTFGLTIGVPPAFQQTNNDLGKFSSSPFAPVSTTSAPLTSTVGTQNSGVRNGTFNSTPASTNTFGLTIGVPPAFQQTNNALGQFPSSPFAPVSTTSSWAPLTNTVGTQNSGFMNNPFNSTPSQPSWISPSQQPQPAFTFPYNYQQQGQTNPSQQPQPAFPFPNSFQQQSQTTPSQQAQPAFTFPNNCQQQSQTTPSQQPQLAFTFPNNFQQQGQTTNPSPQQQPAFTFPNNCQQQSQTTPSQQPQLAFTFPNNFQQQGQTTNPSPQQQPAFTFLNNFQQQQPAVPNCFSQSPFPQMSNGNPSNPAFTQPSVVAMNPFGTLPAMPQFTMEYLRRLSSTKPHLSEFPPR